MKKAYRLSSFNKKAFHYKPEEVWITRETEATIFWTDNPNGGAEMREKKDRHYSGLFFDTKAQLDLYILKGLESNVKSFENRLIAAKTQLESFKQKLENGELD